MASRVVRALGWAGKYLLRAVWISLMVLTPLFGFWLASSLAAYSNASQWLALLVGLALFPLVPVGWDLLFVWRRSRRPPTRAVLTGIDRLVLRTLLVNGLFLGLMLWRAPQMSFRALAVRGDWILDGHHGPIATSMRDFLLGFADTFEKRWHKADDYYGTSDKPPPRVDSTDEVDATPRPTDPTAWPLPDAADPIVTGIPASEQTSIESVGKYFAGQFPDKRLLVKALHDYVVLRLSYDRATFELRGEERYTKRPSQAAVDVFEARTAVCEGYARLMVALGEAAGLEIAYITGYIRTSERRIDEAASDDAIKAVLEGYLHAWNAVKIDGSWMLVDATWDDPVGDTETLRSTYLLTPPKLFRMDHLPEESAWQLTATPLSAGEFARQPLLSPYSGELGLVLEQPTRSQITVDDGVAEIVFENPQDARVLASVNRAGARERDAECRVTPGAKIKIQCSVGSGEYEVRMFGLPKSSDSNSYPYLGTILVNSR